MSSDKEKRAQSEGGQYWASVKRPKVEPDTCVVVGGKEFYEASHHLRSISHYFDAAFRSEMKEAKAMRFEFPDKDPKGWECLMSVCAPLSTIEIDRKNVLKILRWCDLLGITAGLERCDSAMSKHLKERDAITQEYYDELFKFWNLSCQMMLPVTKSTCLDSLKRTIINHPEYLNLDEWKSVISCVREDEENGKFLWKHIKEKIPETAIQAVDADDALLSNPLLPEVMVLRYDEG